MRVSPPKADINIYEDGFKKHDLLSRETQSKNLSELVEKIDESLVVAVDGGWGSGKTFFLKCWLGAHTHENGGNATTVYFDAFEQDYLDDPLIGLTAALASRVEEKDTLKRALRSVKAAAAKIWRPTARVVLAVGTAGVSEVAKPVVDSAIGAASEELDKQVDDFWRKENGRRAAMMEFRSALVELTEPDEQGSPSKKFVFVVDELDRCRPDYALNTLEVVKHFFDVPGVHFVLGVNLKELQSMVRVRYGEQVDALTYLQKFVSVSISLPNLVESGGKRLHTADKYFREMAPKMGLEGKLLDDVYWWIEHFQMLKLQSVRHAQRVLTEISLIPERRARIEKKNDGWRLTLASLILLKHSNAELFNKARVEILSFEAMAEFLGLPKIVDDNTDHELRVADCVWRSILSPNTHTRESSKLRLWGGSGPSSPNQVIPWLLRDHLDAVVLTEEPQDH